MSSVEDRLDNTYYVSDVANAASSSSDPDYGNKTILVDVAKLLGETIDSLERISSIVLDKDHPLTVTEQISVNKYVAAVLTPIKGYVDSKIKEISEEI